MLKLARYLRTYRAECVLSPLFKLLEAIFGLLVPLVMADVIDVGIPAADQAYVIWRGVLLVGMGVLGLASAAAAQYFCAKLAAGFGTLLRDDLFRHVLSLSSADLDDIGRSSLVTRVTNDTQQVQDGVNMFFRLILRSPFVVLGALVLTFVIDGTEGLIYLATIVVLFVVVFAVMYVAARRYRAVQGRLDAILQHTSDNLIGVRVVRAFRREGDEVAGFDREAAGLRDDQVRVGDISGLLNPLTYVATNMGLVAALWAGGFTVDAGAMTQGGLVALVNYSAQILVELVKMANLIIQEAKAVACAARVNEVFAHANTMPDGSESAASATAEVRFDDVTFSYPDGAAPALAHVSFEAAAGQTVGVIGGTGSGKSTLAALLMRFYDAREGTVSLGGRDVRDYRVASLRKAVAIVEQGGRLFSGTIGENLRWGDRTATDDDLMRAVATAQAGNVVDAKGEGLDARVEQMGRNFSGGQRQRLTIARALARHPKVLILDDASSALDFATDAALRGALARELVGTTTFVISQRVTSIRSADKILVLDRGRLVGAGTHDELVRGCDVYREICASQLPPGSLPEASASRGGGA